MLIKQIRTITYVCPECGATHFASVSLFDFSGKDELTINCECKQSCLRITTKDYKKYSVYVPCNGCGNTHKYNLNFYNMWVNPINNIFCSKTGIECCIIGKDNEVRKQLDALEMQNDVIASSLGFEKYFNNSTVMLEAFNRIHDIAKNDNIYCECGCKDISVYMLKDSILLQCTKCSRLEIISAKDNFDLREIHNKEQIILYKQSQYI